MATYTIDTSAAEEKGLDYVVAKRNAARAAENPPKPALTNAEYLDNILVRRSLKAFNDERKAEDAKSVGTAYDAATNKTQSDVRALLGL